MASQTPPHPIGYSHYQPPPQPIQFPYPRPAAGQQSSSEQLPHADPYERTAYPRQQLEQPVSAMTNSRSFAPPLGIGNPFTAHKDFQLFGPHDPLGGIGAGIANDVAAEDVDLKRQLGSIEKRVPDLISDRGSPAIADNSPLSPPGPGPGPVPVPMRPPPRPVVAASSSHSSASGNSYRGEGRASSVPPPEIPRPMRRKTQENLHWPSFVHTGSSSSSSSSASSSAASSSSNFLPTPQQHPLLGFPTPSLSEHSPALHSAFDPSSLSLFSNDSYGFLSSFQPPHTDHPLLPSEQSDLLDRVRRDLLDVDLSSIKGPLRALALSSSNAQPTYSMTSPFVTGDDRDKTPTPRNGTGGAPAKMILSPRSPAIASQAGFAARPGGGGARARPQSKEADVFGTVSPQEAFLDYPAVDSKLHDLDPKDGKLARSDFGVGVGHSLFAPLPTSPPPPTEAKSAKKQTPSTTPLARNPQPSTPPTPSAVMTPNGNNSRSTTPLGGGSGGGGGGDATTTTTTATATATTKHGPHPFSVPQNAVSWATRRSNSGRRIISDDNEDDGGSFGEEEEEEEPVSSTEVTAGEEEEQPEEESPINSWSLPRPRVAEQPEEEEEEETKFSFVPPPPSSILQFAAPPPAPAFKSFDPASRSGTSTPRRAAAANALDDPSPLEVNETGSTKRQRKRSRLAMEQDYAAQRVDDDDDEDQEDAMPGFAPPPSRKTTAVVEEQRGRGRGEDDDEDEYDEDAAAYDDNGDDSDESYHSSSAATTPNVKNSMAPPPKRRRRGAATGSSSTTTTTPTTTTGNKATKTTTGRKSKGAITCDYVSSTDGTVCGVVFRRPYDLARHKETIHGVTLRGDKLPPGKAKEWKCKECGGTFSRKDALLRHGRIRGHKPGV
ncbi:hypothetical protein JCM3766R1_005912 [Sporobolomyces carnicolor]